MFVYNEIPYLFCLTVLFVSCLQDALAHYLPPDLIQSYCLNIHIFTVYIFSEGLVGEMLNRHKMSHVQQCFSVLSVCLQLF